MLGGLCAGRPTNLAGANTALVGVVVACHQLPHEGAALLWPALCGAAIVVPAAALGPNNMCKLCGCLDHTYKRYRQLKVATQLKYEHKGGF